MYHHHKRVRLWKAVIAQAVIDSVYSRDYTFFDLKSQMFIFLCDLADINPTWLVRKIKEFNTKNSSKQFSPSTSSDSFFDTRISKGSVFKKNSKDKCYHTDIFYDNVFEDFDTLLQNKTNQPNGGHEWGGESYIRRGCVDSYGMD